ncbi:MAG: N-methyl-D-aspartate receptor NMDAR2C subunit [Planctomycetes bacterium]|nr:N-methyl-D-aspartate receptor NMDAR2C subunit [Planctomycetota bacterium]
MKDRWMKFWKAAGASGDPEAPWRLLSARYEEPHRAYHTLRHVAHCLDELELVRGLAQDPVVLEMALWYHDAVYDPRSRDNEARIAELAAAAAADLGLSQGRIGRVADLIMASTHHALPVDPEARLFADIDLAILGQPSALFAEYERQVRVEYSWVPDPQFRAGRSAILQSFLDRPFIYGTSFFRDKYEVMARLNLSVSLKQLR